MNHIINNLQGEFNMLTFLKKLFGVKQAEVAQAPYKIEAPVVEAVPTPVNDQITDAVTQSPPEAPKPATEKPVAKRGPKKKSNGQSPSGQKPNPPRQGNNKGRKPKSKA